MLIDLNCPVEVFRTQLPTEEIPAATLTLFNLSDRVAVSVEVALTLRGPGGAEKDRLTYRARALNGRPHSTFNMNVPCTPERGLRSAEAVVEKVWFADNEVWRRNPEDTVEVASNALPVSKALTELRYVAGENAVGYPMTDGDLWLCVCGRPNLEQDIFCVRCGQHRETVFRAFSREAVTRAIAQREKQLDLNSRNMREDTIRMQRLREEEYHRKKKRRKQRLLMIFPLLAVFAICAALYFYAVPALRLESGKRFLAAGDAAEAKKIFESLGEFEGSEDLIAECDWRVAQEKAKKAETVDELEEASRLLRAMPDRPGALEAADAADLQRAVLLSEAGDPQAALEALDALPDDNELKQALRKTCLKAEADRLFETGDYEAAREKYLELGSWENSPQMAARCVYDPAVKLVESGDWDGAIAALSKIPDYEDSRTLTLKCHYMKGLEFEDAGDSESAAAEYLMAGSYEDAEDRMRNITYARADAALASGDLKGAQSLYASIPGWRDADEKNKACLYSLARRAADEQEYILALQTLENVPDDYEDTAAYRMELTYNAAKAAVKREDWETAVSLLAPLDRETLKGRWRDIESLYLEACGGAGVDPYPAEETPEGDTAVTVPGEDADNGEPEAPEAPETPETPENPEPPEASGTSEMLGIPAESPAPDPFLVTDDE